MDGALTILVVSPEPSVVQAVRDVLRRDYRVTTAPSISRALATLRGQTVHIVLADHQPPGMNGMAFLRQVRRDYPDTLRFLFSSSADSWVASAAAGMAHDFRFVNRPWDAEDLESCIRQEVEQQQLSGATWPASAAEASGRSCLTTGTQLGQYELLELLGQGGMGTVYKAVHGLLKRVVALKVLSQEHVTDANAVARFRREMEAVGRLQHPHIVQASDANEVGGTHFLVMEYVEGLDLAQVVALKGPLAVPEACAIIHQALTGLQHAFEHGLVHRDLKPANLMLTPQGQVKILDFGLALLYDDPTRQDDWAYSGRIAGTVDYLAPEVARGPQPVDTRSDIYSLGCTLYELLAGRPPFSGPEFGTVMQKLLAHAKTTPPQISALRPDVDEKLEKVLKRFLAKEPASRFGSPAAAAAALAPFSNGANLGQLCVSLSMPHESLHGQPTQDYSPGG
jgi:serine/threonine protein kinase